MNQDFQDLHIYDIDRLIFEYNFRDSIARANKSRREASRTFSGVNKSHISRKCDKSTGGKLIVDDK